MEQQVVSNLSTIFPGFSRLTDYIPHPQAEIPIITQVVGFRSSRTIDVSTKKNSVPGSANQLRSELVQPPKGSPYPATKIETKTPTRPVRTAVPAPWSGDAVRRPPSSERSNYRPIYGDSGDGL